MSRLSTRLHLTIRRLTHGVTLGVRVVTFNPSGDILLVKHTYTPGWHLPGGGVDKGETVFEAAKRELWEETKVRAVSEPVLAGLYLNRNGLNRDHIALMQVSESVVPAELPTPNLEIAAVDFFPLDGLPDGTTPGTHRRLHELAGQASTGIHW